LKLKVGGFLGFNGGEVGSNACVLSLDLSFTISNHLSLYKSFSSKIVDKLLIVLNGVVQLLNSVVTLSNDSI